MSASAGVSLSLLTLLSDLGSCCRTEPDPVSVLRVHALPLREETSWIHVD